MCQASLWVGGGWAAKRRPWSPRLRECWSAWDLSRLGCSPPPASSAIKLAKRGVGKLGSSNRTRWYCRSLSFAILAQAAPSSITPGENPEGRGAFVVGGDRLERDLGEVEDQRLDLVLEKASLAGANVPMVVMGPVLFGSPCRRGRFFSSHGPTSSRTIHARSPTSAHAAAGSPPRRTPKSCGPAPRQGKVRDTGTSRDRDPNRQPSSPHATASTWRPCRKRTGPISSIGAALRASCACSTSARWAAPISAAIGYTFRSVIWASDSASRSTRSTKCRD